MFSPDELNKFVTDRLNANVNIPDGHKSAVFAYVGVDDSVQAGFAYKPNNSWQLVGDVQYHPTADGLSGGLNLIKTW